MNAKKQYGKGLSGFFVGLLLATAVIAGVLYFLNKNGQSSVKELPKVEEKVPEPEILVPGSSPSASATKADSASQMQTDVVPPAAPEAKVTTESTTKETPTVTEATEADKTAIVPPTAGSEAVEEPVAHPPVVVVPTKPKMSAEQEKAAKEAQKQAQIKKQAEAKRAEAEHTKKQAQAKSKAESKVQPTPEQILNSGNLEKARKEAQAEARKKAEADADRQRAEDALSGRSGSEKQSSKSSVQPKQQISSAKGGKVIIQAGSYNDQQAAEVQRGKLAMAGVSASVVQAEVNGKTVYRVQTGVLSAAEASMAQKKLKQRGINNFARSVK
ncbi:SPOR domain-containing protein [Neisseria wadsworthii]|uniref:Cell division protein FtsN n=1 Tax=Neisseria wadsworthii 9715 TaxID=1030841 RepID=G4CR40_9NEIS|nr:SPOR domain-containing protein [Neisseria wadsworthii]EGZ45600.1 cell division protein FtsN [Neisseria wadsworthii 9715]QMT35256.1 SPOR domain-containing protein [Neisseria wadsworthii]